MTDTRYRFLVELVMADGRKVMTDPLHELMPGHELFGYHETGMPFVEDMLVTLSGAEIHMVQRACPGEGWVEMAMSASPDSLYAWLVNNDVVAAFLAGPIALRMRTIAERAEHNQWVDAALDDFFGEVEASARVAAQVANALERTDGDDVPWYLGTLTHNLTSLWHDPITT